MYTVRMGSDVAEAQIDDLSGAEIDNLLRLLFRPEAFAGGPGNLLWKARFSAEVASAR